MEHLENWMQKGVKRIFSLAGFALIGVCFAMIFVINYYSHQKGKQAEQEFQKKKQEKNNQK